MKYAKTKLGCHKKNIAKLCLMSTAEVEIMVEPGNNVPRKESKVAENFQENLSNV
jgi:hypothetical protein